jgi:ribonuclease BN (tRNA processing enzyme)
MRVLSLLIVASLAAVVSAQAPAPTAAGTRLIMLGTGSPVPDAQAFGPATAIAVGDRLFLIDAGAGVTRRLAAAGFPRVTQVEATFLTHLHSDHTLGYPDLIFTTWIMGRRGPLAVFGPPGLKRMTNLLMDAWREDLDIRIKGLERETEAWLAVDAREIAPGVVYDKDGVRVTAIPVKHGEWKVAFGFRFDTPGRSITISGDAAPTDALVAAAKGTDVLVHEVYIAGRALPENRPGGEFWPQYMREFHTSSIELGKMAAQVKPGLLVLHHVLRMGGTDEELLAGIREGGYTGRIAIAKDLDIY